jgi:Nucleotidyltransferase domain
VGLAERVIGALSQSPAVKEIELVGSRAEGRATELSDWDFRLTTDHFEDLAGELPELVAELEPLAQQWDRLSPSWCYMLILRGPVKVDLIFPDEPHLDDPPWRPDADNLAAIDAHFWDWVLWLHSKEVAGKTERVEEELQKLFDHLLGPLGAEQPPPSPADAVASYLELRERAERELGVAVARDLEDEALLALGNP